MRPFSSLSGRLFLLVREKRASWPDEPRFLSEGATVLAGVVQTGGEVPSCPIFCFSAAGWLFGYVFAQFLALIGRIVLTSERKKAYLCFWGGGGGSNPTNIGPTPRGLTRWAPPAINLISLYFTWRYKRVIESCKLEIYSFGYPKGTPAI